MKKDDISLSSPGAFRREAEVAAAGEPSDENTKSRSMLTALFAKNPFVPLLDHLDKTMMCVAKADELIDAVYAGDGERVRALAREISRIEHAADLVKHEVRARLNNSVFVPVDRRDVLTLLHHMDAIADQAEDLGVLFTMRPMEMLPQIRPSFDEFRRRVRVCVDHAATVVEGFHDLLDAGLGGPDAARILERVDEVGRLEHEADKAQDVVGKLLFVHEDDMKPAALIMWIKISDKLGGMANAAERMVNQLRVMIAR